jgi:low temperature requirement protein LtrA
MTGKTGHRLLRRRDGHEASVGNAELFFDLVYVFAVTQLSHGLLHHLTPAGALESLVLWFAVWLGWQYTCWTTNWFDPERPTVRAMLFALMLPALLMASAIPQAFGGRGWVFALAYVAIQVGRTLFALVVLPRDHALAPNFRRMLGWLCISACFWVAGAASEHGARLGLWAVAVACEYIAPMVGFRLPGLGRSRTADWTVEGGHIAERCQLFVIVALGETLLVSGARLAAFDLWAAPTVIAFLVTFVASLALWWIYFGTSAKDGAHVLAHAEDPGRLAAHVHYVHAVLLAGIIVMAVANDLIIEEPSGEMTATFTAVLVAGPLLFLAGSGLYKRIVYRCWPAAHLAGIVAILLLAGVAWTTDLLMVGGVATAVLIAVGAWEARVHTRSPART